MRASVTVGWIARSEDPRAGHTAKVHLSCGHALIVYGEKADEVQPGQVRECHQCPDVDPFAMFDDLRGKV